MSYRHLLLLLTGALGLAARGSVNATGSAGSAVGYMENRGQFIDQAGRPATYVGFLLHGLGFNVQLRNTGFSYDLSDSVSTVRQKDTSGFGEEDEITWTVRYHRLDLDFIGGNPAPQIIPEGPVGPVCNYYTYGTSEKGALGIRQYERVVYTNVYPGIDVAFTLTDGQSFKYDIIVHPEGDPADIRIRIQGADGTRVTEEGVVMGTRFGELVESIPACYWRLSDTNRPTTANFVEVAPDEFGIQCTEPRPAGAELVIDPVPELLWCSYFSMINANIDRLSAAVDSSEGRFAFAGTVWGQYFIATTGAHQGTYGGGQRDAFVGMVDPDSGTAWLTYFGGVEQDDGIALDVANNKIIVLGQTMSSSNIAFNSTTAFDGPVDGFLARFDLPTGMLELSHYIGGSETDYFNDMALHDTLVYVVGNTNSLSIEIAGVGADGTYNGGPRDGYICAFSTIDLSIHYGSYVGGSNEDSFAQVAWDGENGVYAFGSTTSADGIATPGAYMEELPYDTVKATFMLKFEPLGPRVWGSYYALPFPAYSTAEVEAMNGSVYLVGSYIQGAFDNMDLSEGPILLPTDSSSFMPSPAAVPVQSYYVHFTGEGFISGCSYLSGSIGFTLRDLSAREGRVYLLGNTYSPDMASCGAWDEEPEYYEGVVIRLSDDDLPDWISYFGGSSHDELHAVVSYGDRIYLIGATMSPGLATADAIQTTGDELGSFLFATFEDTCATGMVGAAGPITGGSEVCEGNVEVYSISVVPDALCYEWSVPVGAQILSGQGTESITVLFGSNSGWVRATARSACRAGQSAYLYVTVNVMEAILFAPQGTMLCPDVPSTAVVITDYPFVWNTGPVEDTIQVAEPGPYCVILSHPSGCTSNSDTLQFVNGPFLATSITSGDATPDGSTEVQYSAEYHFGSSYDWDVFGGDIVDTQYQHAYVFWNAQGNGWVAVSESAEGYCTSYDTLFVQVISTGIPGGRDLVRPIVHPVPADELLVIQAGNYEGNVLATVVDASGRVVRQGNLTFIGGRAILHVRELANGTYSLRMASDLFLYSVGLVVDH